MPVNDEANVPNSRHPKDLKGLLKFCMETTRNEDAPVDIPSTYKQMDPERMKWLEEFLNSASVDVIQQLTLCISTLSEDKVLNPDIQEEDLADQELAFGAAEDWTGQIDMANNFHKLGGFQALEMCMRSPHSLCRQGACHLVGELTQNNTYCQGKVVEEEFLPKLLTILNSDPDGSARVKAMYAISCSIRAFEPAYEAFCGLDGFKQVCVSYDQANEKLKTKLSYFLLAMLRERASFLSTCLALDVPKILVRLMSQDTSPRISSDCETHAQLLKAIVSAHPSTGNDIATQHPNFTEHLRQTVEWAEGKPEFYDYCILALDLIEICGSALTDDEKTQRCNLQAMI
ncbi:hypothetical protein TCAL_05618 [Tigriopus californicus]|uniref:Nucleotide exchange factor Fes1 domain-containing protein n=1 Tax=Tigriopus californicus TaxID=6832 RepID=A0A553NUT4_TIGCA|nr:hsp70-binding protein 1-like [Tigriopus californicus]TRY69184.1 hypothetical protein TCAL_05618 [Tigriopus californicus]|eukprot:TCALIF_05618-PA protein Name:"Similar to Hspbp1 Hsp70-binding protein 1 (Mus musculus)" AED:0.19 eAED:0.19 QI:0/-1/0/1/-1/1/1/0/343